MIVNRTLLVLTLAVLANSASLAHGVEHVSLNRDGKPLHLEGKVVAEAQDSLVLLDRMGTLWQVQPGELVSRTSDDATFELLQRDDLGAALLEELPAGFRVHDTANYVICYNTSQAYARWCGALLERLHRGFYGYWANRQLNLDEPPAPLAAVVFDSKKAYTDYAAAELGEEAARGLSFGYYSLRSNRVAMFDLTGADGLRQPRSRASSTAHINRLLAQPGAEFNVATIVHEATHQLAFNSGLQARFADIPLWVAEGMAMYFETPDLRSARGWRTIGAVNKSRLNDFREYLRDRPEGSLQSLLADHTRLRDPRTIKDAYAESWALNYFLIKARSDDYVKYMRLLAEKKPYVSDEPQDRIKLFSDVFGGDLDALDDEFLKFMQRVR